jgi:cell division protein FtsB
MTEDIIMKDLIAKYDLLTSDIEVVEDALKKIDVTSFVLNPEIAQLTAELADLNTRRAAVARKIEERKAKED